MNFGQAIEALKDGERVFREGWNGKGMHLTYVEGWKSDELCIETVPHITLSTAEGQIIPWTASQTDVFAEDWTVKGDVKL